MDCWRTASDSELTAVDSTKNNKFITATSGQVRLGYIMLQGRGDSELTAVNSTKNNKFITATLM